MFNSHPIFLITRPQHQAKNLCAQLEKLGGQCILLPTIEIKTFPSKQIAHTISNLSSIDKAIFTSANAVFSVMPHWHKLKTPTVFAIGPTTAKALADFHITAQTPTEFNSEGLLALPDLQTVQNQHIVIFSGVGGRELLQETLAERGAIVQKVAVYKRECPVLTTPFPPVGSVSAIISTSEESLNNLWNMVGAQRQEWLKEQQLLVISSKMQRLAKQLGFKPPAFVADNATDEAILEKILKIFNAKAQSRKGKTQT